MWYAITLFVSVVFGFLFLKLQFPAGSIIGGMVGVILLGFLTGRAVVPPLLSPLVLCGMGSFIGLGVTKKDIANIRELFRPVLLLLVVMQTGSILSSLAMYRFSDMDLVTALFACAPAGIVDVSIIAASFGGNMPIIAMLQAIRVAIIVLIFPPIFGLLSRTSKQKKTNVAAAVGKNPLSPEKSKKASAGNFLLTIGCGVSWGMFANFLRIPAGAMVFSMASVAALSMFTNRSYIPKLFRLVVQCFGGAVIGARFSAESISLIGDTWPMVFLLTAGLIANSLVVGFLLFRLFKWDLVTALFSSAPGGISDMAIISEDFGADKTRVAFMQLSRFVGIICIYPYIILFLTG